MFQVWYSGIECSRYCTLLLSVPGTVCYCILVSSAPGTVLGYEVYLEDIIVMTQVRKESGTLNIRCRICEMTIFGIRNLNSHIAGKKHEAKISTKVHMTDRPSQA